MKKLVLGLFAAFTLASCGEKLLTPEQIEMEVTKGFDAGKAAIETEVNAKCDADYQARVDAKAAELVSAAEAAAAMPAK
jgi:hypothetical protein